MPCEGNEKLFSRNLAKDYLREVVDWQLVDDPPSQKAKEGQGGVLKIQKKFKFKNFKEALSFVNRVGEIAESEGHHPDINFGWGKVQLTLYTHAIGGLSENDFILAAKIDKIPEVSI